MDTQCSGLLAHVAETMPGSFTSAALPPHTACAISRCHCHVGVSLLDMAPHHRVLDMYGSGRYRMDLISRELDERGELVANIMGALSLESIKLRHTSKNVIMTRLEDERLSPKEVGTFDRVLLDIPALIGRHLSSRQRSQRLVSLLLRAITLCREGGRVVYVTHGHRMQNNEMVVDQVINDAHKGIALNNIAFAGNSGSTFCGGQQLDPRVARTRYVDNETGSDARFLAVLECSRA